MPSTADSGTRNGPLCSALARSFRGKLWDVILRNRSVTTFEKDQAICDAGNENRTFFFLQKGFVKVGSITEDGHELIYDVRKAGDIVGELDRIHSIAVTLLRRKRIERAPSPISRTVTQEGRL